MALGLLVSRFARVYLVEKIVRISKMPPGYSRGPTTLILGQSCCYPGGWRTAIDEIQGELCLMSLLR